MLVRVDFSGTFTGTLEDIDDEGIIRVRENTTLHWVSYRYATPLNVSRADLDSFLKNHWDNEHNHLAIPYLNTYSWLFNAYSGVKTTRPVEAPVINKPQLEKKKKPEIIELSLF